MSLIKSIIGQSLIGSITGSTNDAWILATGLWRDNGIWDDRANWID